MQYNFFSFLTIITVRKWCFLYPRSLSQFLCCFNSIQYSDSNGKTGKRMAARILVKSNIEKRNEQQRRGGSKINFFICGGNGSLKLCFLPGTVLRHITQGFLWNFVWNTPYSWLNSFVSLKFFNLIILRILIGMLICVCILHNGRNLTH